MWCLIWFRGLKGKKVEESTRFFAQEDVGVLRVLPKSTKSWGVQVPDGWSAFQPPVAEVYGMLRAATVRSV